MNKKNFSRYISFITPSFNNKDIIIEMMDKATGIYTPNNEFDLTLEFTDDYVLNFNFEKNVIYVNEFTHNIKDHIFYNFEELKNFYNSKLEIIDEYMKEYKTKESLLTYFPLEELKRIRKAGLKIMCRAEHKHSTKYSYELFILSDNHEIFISKIPNTRDEAFIIYKNTALEDEERRVIELFNRVVHNDSIFDSQLYILNKNDLFKMIETTFSVKLWWRWTTWENLTSCMS